MRIRMGDSTCVPRQTLGLVDLQSRGMLDSFPVEQKYLRWTKSELDDEMNWRKRHESDN